MLASLALVRRDLATSLMLEAVTREKPKDWFEYVRAEDFSSEDLEVQFLLLFGDNVIPVGILLIRPITILNKLVSICRVSITT